MKILTIENEPFDLNTVPDEVEDMRYCVLDASDKDEIDFYFLPLIFLESFHAPAICLQIGNSSIQMPMDWSILICDDDYGGVEVIPLTSLNNRGFKALATNPLSTKIPDCYDITITNIYQDVKWFFPKLKHGHMLAVPLESKDKPRCAYFVKEQNKICNIEVGDLM
jgi:hypothetical protein|tara:strand:- start:11 stop:508 length:498 start_codon:yes stop_codon:yes gene_type:complete